MNFEISIYFFGWTASVMYSVYCFSSTAYEYFRHYKDEFNDFTEGLQYFSKRDKADLEWESIMFLINQYFPWVFTYLIGSQAIKTYCRSAQVLKIWQILFTITYTLLKWNYIFLTLLMFQPVFFYTTSHLKNKTVVIWTTTAFSLVLLNYFKSILSDSDIFEMFKLKDYEMYVLVSSLFWMNLKCTSFCLENSDCPKTLIDIFSYCLYPPTVLSGPFILYQDFQTNYEIKKLSVLKCKQLFKNIFRVLFWYVLSYICLHFVYVNAAAFHQQLIENFGGWSLYGFGYAMGQFFHLKYIVSYGASTSLASFECISVPSLPRCIGRVHLYSDMWKYFDPGLYKFLVRNIYLPLVKITENKSVRSLVCFCFVYVWHGLEVHILIWAVVNYSGLIFENLMWPKEGEKKSFKKIVAGQCWQRRVDCFIAAFILAMSAICNFYFFAGTDVGNVFSSRFITDLNGTAILIAALYCCSQVSTELRSVPASKM